MLRIEVEQLKGKKYKNTKKKTNDGKRATKWEIEKGMGRVRKKGKERMRERKGEIDKRKKREGQIKRRRERRVTFILDPKAYNRNNLQDHESSLGQASWAFESFH